MMLSVILLELPAGEYLASCSQEGSVVVSSLLPDSSGPGGGGSSSSSGKDSSVSEQVYTYGAPMTAVR